jgi:hypothetical protein
VPSKAIMDLSSAFVVARLLAGLAAARVDPVIALKSD